MSRVWTEGDDDLYGDVPMGDARCERPKHRNGRRSVVPGPRAPREQRRPSLLDPKQYQDDDLVLPLTWEGTDDT